MTKQKPVLKPIQTLYKRNQIDLYMFGWVRGVKKYLSGASVTSVVNAFLEEHLLTEEDYPCESATTTYFRILKDFEELKKEA